MAAETKQQQVDKDLDNLLDSALDDFDKPKQPVASVTESAQEAKAATDGATTPAPATKKEQTSGGTGGGGATDASAAKDESGPWTAEFAQMEEAMKMMLGQDPLLQERLSQIASTSSKAAGATSDGEFAATFQATLDTITRSIEQFQTPGGVDAAGADGAVSGMDEMTRLLGAMGFGGGDGATGETGGFLQVMQGMMQNLLSKELLYPALKDLTEKYPKWLEENRDKTSAADIARYEKQLEIMTQVCATFDEENDSDSQDVKKDRFDRVLKMMQQMQECGNPPAELVEAGEGIPGLPSGELPDMPPPPPECNQQ